MSPHPKDRRNRALPDFLTFDRARGQYRYQNPQTGRRTYIGKDRQAAIQAAKRLNAKLAPVDADIELKVMGGGESWRKAVDTYLAGPFTERDLKENTRPKYRAYLRKLRDCKLAKMSVADITTRDCVRALDAITTGHRMRNVYRNEMIAVFQHTIEIGWRADNPAAQTRSKKTKRRRERLTIEGFRAIRKAARPWVRVAMDLALVTLQRREDVASMQYSDIEDERLSVEQSKTGKRLRIAVGRDLREAIASSRDGKVCPYIVHLRQRTTIPRAKWPAWRQHAMQVSGEQIQRAFKKARDESGYYDKSEHPPTFHEIRSLGGDQYRQAGWSEQQIQALMGHEDVSMTRGYLAGHEEPWQEVSGG